MGERETHLHQGNSGQAGCEKRWKSALARDFRTYAQSPYHCRAIQRATARGASPPRTPPSRHFRPSHQPHTALPSRHILQYVTHIAPTEGTHPHKRPGGVDAIMDGGRNVVTSAFASSRPRRKDSTPRASLRHLRIRRHRPPLSCDTGLLTFPRPSPALTNRRANLS